MNKVFTTASLVALCSLPAKTAQAQDMFRNEIPEYEIVGSDTVKTFILDDITVYPDEFFQILSEDPKYRKKVRDVKKVLPYSKLIYTTLIETYEYIMTFPDEEERQAHLKQMEKDLFAEYKRIQTGAEKDVAFAGKTVDKVDRQRM